MTFIGARVCVFVRALCVRVKLNCTDWKVELDELLCAHTHISPSHKTYISECITTLFVLKKIISAFNFGDECQHTDASGIDSK